MKPVSSTVKSFMWREDHEGKVVGRKHMQSSERRQAIIVLDFGSQYSRLITRRVRECHVYSELVPASTTLAQLLQNSHLDIRGFILSGGPSSVYDMGAPACDPAILASGLPILGICYGMHLLAHQLGGHVAPATEQRQYGPATLEIAQDTAEDEQAYRIFGGIAAGSRLPVLMSHGDSVDILPPGF